MNQKDIDMIRTELTPKCEVHISKDFKQRVLAKAKESRKPRNVIRMWHWLSVSGIAACLPVILMLSPSRLTGSSLLQNAISYLNNIRIPLCSPYKAKDGKTYNNYGTYLLRQYYDKASSYRNSYTFAHEVCPGFFFEITERF